MVISLVISNKDIGVVFAILAKEVLLLISAFKLVKILYYYSVQDEIVIMMVCSCFQNKWTSSTSGIFVLFVIWSKFPSNTSIQTQA
jgi:hypothetical protein